jgi:hypothetical protein
MRTLTELITSNRGRSASAWARQRRHKWLLDRFPNISEMRVLDLGGEAHTWAESRVHPREVVLLNVPWNARQQEQVLQSNGTGDWIRAVEGDACDPPDEIRSDHFDFVYSNSVIEHVGGHQRRQAFAWFAATLGDHCWIQTPNRYFPIEPHWLCPGFQFLPPHARAAVTLVWPLGNYTNRRDSLQQRLGDALGIELLSASEMQFYFPETEILRERVGGLAKSLIAMR